MNTTSKSNGRAKLPLSPDQNVPIERVCRVCGLADGLHEDDCPNSLSPAAIDLLIHSHNPNTCHHCSANRELARHLADKAENAPPSPGGEGRGEGGITPSPTPHVCLAANCGTLLAPEDFFCEYHFQKLPADLLWAYVKSADGPPRQMLLQQMADTLAREPHADPALLTDLRDFVQGVRNDILDSDPHAERIQAVQQIDALIWRTSKALEANPGRAKLPLSPDQNVPSPNSPSPQRGEGRGEEAP